MRNIFGICLIPVLALILYSCECVVKPPCNGVFDFILRDKITKQDLVEGAYARYSIDSIKLIAGADTTQYPSPIILSSQNQLACYLNGSSDTLYLKLNTTDTDTLLLSFRHYSRTECCPSGSRGITDVVFNGVTTSEENGAFILEK